MKPKILISAPTHKLKNYCIFEWVASARMLGCDIFLVDNTPDNANKDMYYVLGINYAWCDPKGKSRFQAVTDSQNMIREYFLKHDYDILWFIETDLFPTPAVRDRLLLHDKPVVGAPYFIHTGEDTRLMVQYLDIDNKGNGEFRELNLTDSFLPMDGTLKQVHGMGFGCVMIKRDVVDAVEFRCNPDSISVGEAWADSFFYSDLAREGLPVFLDTTEVIKHLNQDWVKVVEKPNVLN